MGAVDLVDVDLAREVTIKARHIDVYPSDHDKPPLGTKLNMSALVTLEGGMKPKKAMSAQVYESSLKSMVEQRGGVHLSYDIDKFCWMFKVPNF